MKKLLEVLKALVIIAATFVGIVGLLYITSLMVKEATYTLDGTVDRVEYNETTGQDILVVEIVEDGEIKFFNLTRSYKVKEGDSIWVSVQDRFNGLN